MEERSKEMLGNKHWSEILVDEIINTSKVPYVLTGGMTTSGPAHLGTICEFLYPSVLQSVLQSKGYKTEFHFVGDIFDAFDSVPLDMKNYEKELVPELGKPLSNVLDPLKCHDSFGEHYLSQAIEVMQRMELKIDLIKAQELYTSGSFDPFARLFLREEIKVREIVARTSLRKIEELESFSPIMPLCENCGRIATTRVIWHDEEEYEYACDRDVKYTKGCGYHGRAKITDHKYKLQWRLHWPAWQAYFNSNAECSGVDHMTRGGSADTAIAIHKEILKRDPPLFFKYGFVLLHGRKYSKSKGTGMSALELTGLMPQELLKYALIVPNLQQNKDIDPTGDKLIALYEDIERIAKLNESEDRADEKKIFAFKLLVNRLKWSAPFLEMLLNYQIYRDWSKVSRLLNDEEGVAYLSPYITEWLKRDFEPERYNFAVNPHKISNHIDAAVKFSSTLKPGMSDVEVHNLVYAVAKDAGISANELFAVVYSAIIGKDRGPKLGKLITAIGIEKTKEILNSSTS